MSVRYHYNKKKKINNYQHKENRESLENISNKNIYKYTKKKPKKIIKNIDLVLNTTNDDKTTRFNTETSKNINHKRIIKMHKGESTRNNNKLEKLGFSNTYTNFSFGEKNEKSKHNKIKIKSINYISNNDDIKNPSQYNFSQNESQRQYNIVKYISPSKNLYNNNFIHKTWTNNFLYKKKNSFNNSMRKIKQYPKISKEDNDESEDE